MSSAYKFKPASDNDWGRLLTDNRKRSGRRIEHCPPYLNNPTLDKTLSMQNYQNFLFER